MYLFVGLDGTAHELGLHSSNLWVLPQLNGGANGGANGAANGAAHGGANGGAASVTELWSAYMRDPQAYLRAGHRPLLLMGFPSCKDPTHAARHPGKETCVLITEAHASWFADWAPDAKSLTSSGPAPKRAAAYAELKKLYEGAMLEQLHAFFPKTRGKVSYVSAATPLTNSHYLGRAASYGLEPSTSRFTSDASSSIRMESDVPGLYLAGQDVTTAGFAGALNGGALTAMKILGYGLWDLLVCDRNLIDDLRYLRLTELEEAKRSQ